MPDVTKCCWGNWVYRVVLDGFVFLFICLGVLLGWFGKMEVWVYNAFWLVVFHQHIWKIWERQIGSWNPKVRGENKKYLSCHHLALYSYFLRIFQQTPLEHTPRPSTTCLWRKSLHICILGYLGVCSSFSLCRTLFEDKLGVFPSVIGCWMTQVSKSCEVFFSFATLTSFLLDVNFSCGLHPPTFQHLTARHWKWAVWPQKVRQTSSNYHDLVVEPTHLKNMSQNGFIFPR